VSRRLKLKVEGVVFAILHGAQQSSFDFFFFVLVPLRLAAACQPVRVRPFRWLRPVHGWVGSRGENWAQWQRNRRVHLELSGWVSRPD